MEQTTERIAAIAKAAEDTSMDLNDALSHSPTDENKEASLNEITSAIVDEHNEADAKALEDEPPADPSKAESDESKKNDQETEPKTDELQEEEPEVKPLTAEEKAELEASFQQSERFQELNKQVDEAKPFVDWAKNDLAFMQKHGITQEDWTASRELLALSKTNPDEFWSKIDLLHEQYDISKGKRLPTDLQEAVDKQEMGLEWAKKVALQRLETERFKLSQQQLERQNAQTWSQTIASTANDWDLQKAKTDADFRPKKAGEPDGKYEMVAVLAKSMAEANPPRDAVGLRAILDAAYNQVTTFQKRLTPRTRVRTRVLPNGSSKIANEDTTPGSLQEAVQLAVGSKHGLRIGAE